MSATGQAASGGDGGAAQGEGQAQQQSGPDLNELAGRLDQHGQTLEEIRGFFQTQREQGQQQQAEPVDETPDMSEFLRELDQGLNLGAGTDFEAANKHLADVVGQVADQRAQALVAPIQQQLADMQHNQIAQDLVNEFPEMAEEATAKRVVGQAQQWAAENYPPEIAKVVANHPGTWRMMYMAGKAAESANDAGSGDSAAASLESGNGAGPGAQQQVDRVKQIMEAGGRGKSVLDF